MTTEKRVWKSGLEYALGAAFEAGFGVENIKLCLSVSGVDGEAQAIRLAADLAKYGARVTRQGEVLTVEVHEGHASDLLRANGEAV